MEKDFNRPPSKAMDIVHFVKLSDVDPIYFETSSFSVPEEAGRRTYALLLHSTVKLERSRL
jgi:DNA end-binding protein Ku